MSNSSKLIAIAFCLISITNNTYTNLIGNMLGSLGMAAWQLSPDDAQQTPKKCSAASKELIEKAEKNDFDGVKAALQKSDVDINASYDEITALEMAVFNKNIEMVKYLIEHGASAKNTRVLFLVEDPKIAQLLIDHGAPINAKIFFNDVTALHFAILENDYKLVELFIKNGADVNEKIFKILTPLQLAVKKKDAQMVELLLGHGADATITDKDENRYEKEYCPDCECSADRPNEIPQTPRTPLKSALDLKEKAEHILKLLEKGVTVEKTLLKGTSLDWRPQPKLKPMLHREEPQEMPEVVSTVDFTDDADCASCSCNNVALIKKDIDDLTAIIKIFNNHGIYA